MSDTDHSSRAPAGAAPAVGPPAGPDAGLGTAAASPAPYNASTAQEAATSLVRLLMEQMGFGPDDIAPGGRGPADEPVRPPRSAEDLPGTRCHRRGDTP
ncbi:MULTISPECIES: hypothetical protein [Streptomyces]|uniref:hypothetical protein n=1 Tax=Streptomyces TaxID=1883 RepID=UPI0002DF74A8|nr:hypothetical protein [Streptomyces griseus]MBW3703079.1 hypothetical protein [Streptomyces griseus]NEB55757.1 hypothetical protein [Streptomyces griseus]SED73625.1 hypothetical protein SAMN04490359_1661 [Streptomyces griseus]SQA24586.1 Uncharacterised protein [Streptomyces griseus]